MIKKIHRIDPFLVEAIKKQVNKEDLNKEDLNKPDSYERKLLKMNTEKKERFGILKFVFSVMP